jgi:hypothetical protein
VRLSPAALSRLSGPENEAVTRTGSTEPDGWTRAVLPVESAAFAVRRFVALGPEIEVLAPPAAPLTVGRRDPRDPRPLLKMIPLTPREPSSWQPPWRGLPLAVAMVHDQH